MSARTITSRRSTTPMPSTARPARCSPRSRRTSCGALVDQTPATAILRATRSCSTITLADRWILTHFAFALRQRRQPRVAFLPMHRGLEDERPGRGRLVAVSAADGSGRRGAAPCRHAQRLSQVWHLARLPLYGGQRVHAMPAGTFVGTAYASFSRSDLESGAALTWSLGFINNTSDPFTMIPSNLLGNSLARCRRRHAELLCLGIGRPRFDLRSQKIHGRPELRRRRHAERADECEPGDYYDSDTSDVNVASARHQRTRSISIDDRLMQKVQYRKVGGAESLWVVHTVQTSCYRTLPAVGADRCHGRHDCHNTGAAADLRAGYDALSLDGQPRGRQRGQRGARLQHLEWHERRTIPSIAYSGRLASDPLNQLAANRDAAHRGRRLANQQLRRRSSCHRWGDYTAMSVDPADDCTFWYTNEYYSSPGKRHQRQLADAHRLVQIPILYGGHADRHCHTNADCHPDHGRNPNAYSKRHADCDAKPAADHGTSRAQGRAARDQLRQGFRRRG